MRTPFAGRFLPRVFLAGSMVLSFTGASLAQTPFVPYYGKNIVRYDRFDWHIYKTDHFEIYYYPETETHLERVAGYAESAYQQISSELKHDLAFKVPLIVFKTHTEFQQENVIPGAAVEGVAAFAESDNNRMLLPLDDPPDLLYRLIVHELTHIFEFDIIPPSLIRANTPLWINEGLSDYMTGYWAPLDLATVRDAAVSDIVPKMTEMEGYGEFGNPRLVYNLGHAAFEFMESRWGKDGIRQFLFALRKSVIGGGENAYEEAFRIKPEEFDQEFEKYLKDRFKPFRDKERPGDYGKNLAPDSDKTRYSNALSAEPSPSGDLFALMTGNRRDRELDIVIVSAKDGSVIRNLTSGFDQDYGFESISLPGRRWNTVSWMSWSPGGDRIAYFVRSRANRVLVLQNILTKAIEHRIDLPTVDEPESPHISPDGKTVVFAGLRNARGDIFQVDLETRKVTNLTDDEFWDFAPVFSPDGRFIVYLARISGNDKLFRLDLDTKKKTQVTFGTHDDAAARFIDDKTIVFASTATDPMQPVDPDIAKNGVAYNIWTLDLETGELRQWTDALGANVAPVVIKQASAPKIAFISYDKGEYGLHTLERTEPMSTAASADFGAPGPVIDFQAPLTHSLVRENSKRKGTFEKLFLDGRPPVNVGVTSGGDIFGGTQVSFTDVLGDRRLNIFAGSISQYRSYGASYVDLSRRLQWAVQGFSQKLFYYGYDPGLFFDPYYSTFLDRDDAVATRTIQGGSVFGIYPLDLYRRLEVSGALLQYKESFNNADLEQASQDYQELYYGNQLIQSGTFMPISIAFVQETTVFREFGPLAGNTMRISYEVAPKIGNSLSRQTVDVDLRQYIRLAGTGVLALRARGFKSWGAAPDFLFFGGNSEMRGYDYLEFLGQNAVFLNAELRFPIIEAMLTPIGVLGGVRGVFFADMGGGWWNDSGYRFFETKTERFTPIIGYQPNFETLTFDPVYGDPVDVSGFRLRDGRASYGIGLETFVLGFPLHFDWSWRTLFNRQWEDLVYAGSGGSASFRKPRFQVWIGYDF
ncbi:MAG: hypothetical protein ACE148_04305 [Vicinamibacterales bacterium]